MVAAAALRRITPGFAPGQPELDLRGVSTSDEIDVRTGRPCSPGENLVQIRPFRARERPELVACTRRV
jgi:hypothetical protein